MENDKYEQAIENLENLLVKWYLDVRSHLDDDYRIPLRCIHGMKHITDEIAYWEERLMDLEFITAMLNHKEISLIFKTLSKYKSPFIVLFDNMTDRLAKAIVEARSNINYLQILKQPCMKLFNVKNLNEIMYVLPEIFFKIIFILEESEYYNMRSHFDLLCYNLGNQIMYLCHKTINLATVLDRDVESILDLIHKSLQCCEIYIHQLNEFVKIYNSLEREQLWAKAKFVYKFIERWKDLKYIIKAKIVFKRLNIQHLDIPKPKFSFPPGLYLENYIEMNERHFDVITENLRKPLLMIFNVTDEDWTYHMSIFQNKLGVLCANTEQVIEMALNVACNEEDCLHVMQCLRYFAEWPPLEPYFRRKTDKVFNFVMDDIKTLTRLYSKNKYWVCSYTPDYSGASVMATVYFRRITKIKKMIASRPWLLASSIGTQFRKAYNIFMHFHRRVIAGVYRKWREEIDQTFLEQLDKRVLVETTMVNQCRAFVVDLDSDVYDFIEEIIFWKLIGKGVPPMYMEFAENALNMKLLHRNAIMAVKNYNYLIASLSKQEVLLFSQFIHTCVKTITPLVYKCTWFHCDMANNYLLKCYNTVDSVQDTEDTYKHCNIEILTLCNRISNMVLYNIVHSEIKDLKKIFSKNISHRAALTEIITHYNEIVRFVTVVYEEFEKYIHYMLLYWEHYVEKIDILINESLILNVQWSMQNVLSEQNEPIYLINTSLENQKIKLSPSLVQLMEYSEKSLSDMVIMLKDVPRLCNTFKIPNIYLPPYNYLISVDPVCCNLQATIDQNTCTVLVNINTFLEKILIYQHIWSVDKLTFFTEFKAKPPTLRDYDIAITVYTESLNYFRKLDNESTSTWTYVILSVEGLKRQIEQHCEEWLSIFSQMLVAETKDVIDNSFGYIMYCMRRVVFMPQTLIEMIQYIKFETIFQKKINKNIMKVNMLINNFVILEKHHIEVSEMKNSYYKLKNACSLLMESQEKSAQAFKEKQYELRGMVLHVQDRFKEEILQFNKSWTEYKKTSAPNSDLSVKDAIKFINLTQQKHEQLQAQEKQLESDLTLFDLKYTKSMEFDIEEDMSRLKEDFKLIDSWNTSWNNYKTNNFWQIEMSKMENIVQNVLKKLNESLVARKSENWKVTEMTRDKVDAFRRVLPLVNDLKNPAMRVRHWDSVREAIHTSFDETGPDFTLEAVMRLEMQKYSDQISEISNRATMELNIENSIKSIRDVWANLNLTVERYNNEGVYRVKVADDILQMLEDHLVQLYAMTGSKYISVFIKEANYLEKSLGLIMEVLETILSVQRQYVYAENIFKADDIRDTIPEETKDFEDVTEEWKRITAKMNKDKNIFNTCNSKPLLKRLNAINDKFSKIQKALDLFMETKRNSFPRFYFISNDDLLDILVNSNNTMLLQPHFKKCFDNINKLELSKNEILGPHYEAKGMYSADGEYIPFQGSVRCVGAVEDWFRDVEQQMRKTLKAVFNNVMDSLKNNLKTREEWILKWPGQLCITASQVQWTVNCTLALVQTKTSGNRAPLKNLSKKQKKILSKFSDAIRGRLTKINRLKIVALVTIEIHARDVIDKMYKSRCMDVSDFEWMSQLRFYWDKKTNADIYIRQTNTEHTYGYEYLGNSGRLVITPLTDRCYITLTTALHLFRGGSPKGPAGTGKTETVKDLGKNLAYYVIVINCSEGLDYKSMGRMFSGLAQQGAWGCFDEFNRINIEVLSVVAQQILSVYTALAAGDRRFVFQGTVIGLVATCGIFITMNPGYAGRTELPDNLKSMFRAISMMVPDSKLIAEITLFGEGFRETRNLANKVYVLFLLCRQQLSKQDHYEFGLRGMVALLRYSGQCRRQYVHLADEEVLLLAMHNMNLAKLTMDDLPLFMGITNDLFPKIVLPEVKNDTFISAIKRCMLKNNHQPTKPAISKIVQLYETKMSRHSVMILGYTGAAKTTTWKTLRDAMTMLKRENVYPFEKVIEYPLNPKALTLGELYGEYNLSTQEWMDGVLSSIMRKTCSDSGVEQKWILFDGPVDAVWIENMNSVMDDNKVLTLINSERITMPEQVSLLFEVEDLAVASPATVSRCGIVYNDYKHFSWKPYVDSWLKNCDFKPYRDSVEKNFERYIDSVLEFKYANCVETVPVPELSAVKSLCTLLEHFTFGDLAVDMPIGLGDEDYEYLVNLWFLFCTVWSVCAGVNEDGRRKMDSFFRLTEKSYPVLDTVYHYYVDTKTSQFRHWDNLLYKDLWTYDEKLPFFKIVVPTLDTVRYNCLVNAYMHEQQPVLLVGPVGTGKTSAVQKALDAMNKDKYLMLTINMSAQTTARNVQETIEGRLEKRAKDLYTPQSNKTLVAFLDDMNMPEKEIYGAQPPLELIRQWIDYEFWYDRQNQTLKNVKHMLLIGAMGPPGGGRNTISNRVTSCFSVINLTFPEEPQISKIFSSMLHQHLKQFDEHIRNLKTGLTEMTIGLYKHVVANLLPTPTKIHYLFNMRDISKVFQGLLRSNSDCQKSKESMLRLWCNEVLRVFNDKLIDKKDREWFMNEINAQLGKYYDQTYRSLCPSDRSLFFCDFLNKDRQYEEVADELKLRAFLDDTLDQYNSNPGVVPMNLVLFRDAVDHICRIVRVVSQPRGYILLVGIGGSGRSSLAKLSNWLCGYSMFTIELTKTYGLADFKEDLKRLYKMTGVKDQPTSFLFSDTQVVDESFLETINNILSTGEVTKLFKDDEFDEIKDALSDTARRLGVPETTDAIYSFFLDRVRSNMHIILCLSPIGNKFRLRLRQYPSLINCTTIDWFMDWPKEALLEVAFRSLTTVEVLETITGLPRVFDVDSEPLTENELKMCIANLFSIIHHSVVEYSNIMIQELKRYNYVTPTNYLELVSGYKETLCMKRIEVANAANKLRNGLFKIDDTSEKVAGMTVDLEKATEKVRKYTLECDRFLRTISDQTSIADQQKKEVDEKSVKIKEEEIVCRTLYSIAVADLEKAMPALEEAMEALNALNKKDLSEVKSFSKPPERVKLVLEAVMILKQSEPSWTEAKRQLGDPNFLTQLKDFDKDHISQKTLKKINTYTKNPEFEPEKVGAQSVAAKSLAKWVIAIEKYAIIYKVVAPKKETADSALASLNEKQLALAAAQEKLSELQKLLLKLNKDFEKKMEEKEHLIKKANELKRNLQRAASLIDGLSGERARWTDTVKELDVDFDYLPGDCLLSIAFVSYMGPFVFKYRDILSKIWFNSVKDMKIPNNPKYEIRAFLSTPAIIRNWNIHGLPNDDFSIDNGIIISRGSRWPLIIDPQCQALKWIKNMEAQNDLKFIDFCLPGYMNILEQALKEGQPVLLQITSEQLDPSVMPVLSKSIVKKGDQLYIKMGDRQLPYNDNFRFFILTKIRNPYYPPEIFTRTTVVNFAIKEEGLEDQLLDLVIRMEKPKLKELKDKLIINIDKGKRTLIELEDELLRLFNESEGSLLDNDELFQTLGVSKITSVAVNEQLETAFTTQAEINVAREGYRPCAKRAALLFFVLNDLSQVDPMYQFSLDSYMDLFENSIKKSEKDPLLVHRLVKMNYYHTYAVYQNTCRGLFEVHKLLFSFQICICLLISRGAVNVNDIEFLLKGGIVLNRESQTENPCAGWLPSSSWDNITELDKIPGFFGIEKSFAHFSREWKQWYMSPEPENLNLVGKWNEHTNLLKKLLFVRCLRLDRLSFAMSNFVADELGSRFVEPPAMDLNATLDDSNCKTPLIFLLSPGVDPTGMLMNLASDYFQLESFKSLSLGQGQALYAERLIKLGQEDGSWVYLANCHLSLSWMPLLDKIIDNMQSGNSHPDFRLWLSSNPHPDFPIAILQSGIKMTTEPPKGIKANMKRLYHNINEKRFSKCVSQEKYQKLMFSLCFFHSILIERKKFQSLGWNVVYSFNESDFDVSENLLSIYLDEYQDTPWEALKYLIAGICYGGQVTDEWDRKLLNTYINQYFNENVLTTAYYRLSSAFNYYVPRMGDLQWYRDFVDQLPAVDPPNAFGQHSNAEMASLMGVNRTACETLLTLQGRSSSADEENVEDKVLDLASRILKKMPDAIDYALAVKTVGAKKNPLDVVLLQEVSRYNDLLEQIKMSLIGLEKGIQGLVVMSSDLEEVFQCINEGRVPGQWLKTYPSLMPLGSWTLDLIERFDHFNVWVTKAHPPIMFWLGAYTYPTSFLTAVLQIHSRRSSVPIDLLSWDFTPITVPEKDIVVPPQSGVYVRNLYLEGADWNFEKSCLCESVPLKFITNLPVIHFKPVQTASRKKGLYQCPAYYYPQRCGTQGRDAFVVVINLNSGQESPDYWTKRATAVLLNLST